MQKLPCINHCCVKECKPWLFSTFRWITRTRDCHTWWKKAVYAVVYNLKSGNYLTYFEQLKHGLQRYQSIHQQTTKQTKSHCAIKKESKYFWDYWQLPVQLCPSPINPDLHMHMYDPCVLLHEASLWHFPINASHLSVSVVSICRKIRRKERQERNTWIKYQLNT